jgi:hypothetical protein
VSCLRNPMAARLERVLAQLSGFSGTTSTLDYYAS